MTTWSAPIFFYSVSKLDLTSEARAAVAEAILVGATVGAVGENGFAKGKASSFLTKKKQE